MLTIDTMTTGQRVRWLRERAKLTQGELAERVNRYMDSRSVALETISRIETDKNFPSGPMLKALADALNTTTDFLLERWDVPDEPGPSRYPVPEPTEADIVARLNALPEDERRSVAETMRAVLRMAEDLLDWRVRRVRVRPTPSDAEAARRVQREQFDRLWAMATPEEIDEVIALMHRLVDEESAAKDGSA